VAKTRGNWRGFAASIKPRPRGLAEVEERKRTLQPAVAGQMLQKSGDEVIGQEPELRLLDIVTGLIYNQNSTSIRFFR
jgi:hypothetical protein